MQNSLDDGSFQILAHSGGEPNPCHKYSHERVAVLYRNKHLEICKVK